jgi:hypothetical protein
MNLLHHFLIIPLIILGFHSVHAQSIVSDPRNPTFWSKPEQIGGWIGFGSAMQNNSLITDACNCSFEGGRGLTFSLGLSYENELTSKMVWGAGLDYRYIGMDARYQETEQMTIEKTAAGTKASIMVPFRHNAELKSSYIGITPYIKYFVGTRFFGRVGINAGMLISPTLTHTKQLLIRSAVLSSGETVIISLDPSTDPRIVSEELAIIQDGPLAQANSFYIGLQSGLGAEFRVGKRAIIGPTVLYTIPFTGMSSYPNSNFTIANLQVLAELRIALD